MGSSSFDQNSGSFLLVGFNTNFVERMIVFNTYTNTYETGFIPGNVSEIICDNYAFAQSAYGTMSTDEMDQPDILLFPNPASTKITLHSNGFENWLTIQNQKSTQTKKLIIQ